MYVERLNDLFSSRLLSTKYERLFIDVDQPLRAPFRVSEVFRFHSACVGCHEIMDRLCFRLCGSCQYLTSWHSTAVSCICVIFVHPAKVSALVGFFLVAAGALDFTHRSLRAYSCLGSSKPTCTNAVVRACWAVRFRKWALSLPCLYFDPCCHGWWSCETFIVICLRRSA